MSHVKSHTRVTAGGKTVFVREHLTARMAEIPKYGEHPKGYEGPVHGEKDGTPNIEYLVSTTNKHNPEKKLNWRLPKHPEEHYTEKVKEFETLKSDLLSGRTTPRRVLGRGATSKKAAMAWIDEQLEDSKKDLAEVASKKIPRYAGGPLKAAEPEKPKKEVQHRVDKEGADHLFGKDIKKSHVAGHARHTASGKVVMVREHEDNRILHGRQGQFTHKETGKHFEYRPTEEAWYKEHGATHEVDVKDIPGTGSGKRGAIIKKTVAHVIIDEDDDGKPVWEKWPLKNNNVWEKK